MEVESKEVDSEFKEFQLKGVESEIWKVEFAFKVVESVFWGIESEVKGIESSSIEIQSPFAPLDDERRLIHHATPSGGHFFALLH